MGVDCGVGVAEQMRFLGVRDSANGSIVERGRFRGACGVTGVCVLSGVRGTGVLGWVGGATISRGSGGVCDCIGAPLNRVRILVNDAVVLVFVVVTADAGMLDISGTIDR